MYKTKEEIKEEIKNFEAKIHRNNRASEILEDIETGLKELQELGFEVIYNTTASVREQIREENTYTIKN